MNTTSTSPPSAQPPRDEAVAHRDNAGDAQRSADFERLLREKASKYHEEDDASNDAQGSSAAMGVPAFVNWPAPLPPKRSDGEGNSGSAAVGGSSDATSQAMHAALGADPGVPQQLAPTRAAGAWELTLRQPLGAAVDVRATRNAESVNGWSLTIGSPTLDASVLARHAPRLNERLKARGLSNTHARIEESDQEEQP